MANIFIVGVDGFIGQAAWKFFHREPSSITGTSKKGAKGLPYLDLQFPNIHKLGVDFRPFTYALIAAACCKIKQCELEPSLTYGCNVKGTLELARQFIEEGITPILFSTDYIFDGIRGGYLEEDLPSPLNEYGRQKAELEERIQSASPGRFLVLRLTKVFSRNPLSSDLLGELFQKFSRGDKVYAAKDQIFSPVFIQDLLRAITSLVSMNARGIYNVGGSEIWSRFDFAREVATFMNVSLDLVQPISLDDLQEPFKRPKNTHLVVQKMMREVGWKANGLKNILFGARECLI